MLPALTVAFLVGLSLGSSIPFFPIAVCCAALTLAWALTFWERGVGLDSRRGVMLYAAMLAGLLYWTAVTPAPSETQWQPQPSRRDVAPIELTGRITAPVQHGPARQTVLIELERTAEHTEVGHVHRVRLVWREPGAILLEGDRIQLRAKLHPPSGSLNPGGFDYAGYLERHGIDAVATVTGVDAIRVLESGMKSGRWVGWNAVDRWRAEIREAAVRTLSQPALGMYLGIVIGERGYLEQDLQEWLLRSSISIYFGQNERIMREFVALFLAEFARF